MTAKYFWVLFIWIPIVGAICTNYLENKIMTRLNQPEPRNYDY